MRTRIGMVFRLLFSVHRETLSGVVGWSGRVSIGDLICWVCIRYGEVRMRFLDGFDVLNTLSFGLHRRLHLLSIPLYIFERESDA